MSKHPRAATAASTRLPVRLVRSTLALGIALALPAGALHAQEGAQSEAANTAESAAEAQDFQTVEVRGIRGSLMRAQEIKRDADQIVDSVTAQDIGALPDRSVTETLKRVSGVTVTNFLARDDPDHFSAEGSGVMIRGLTQVRGELNGRDVFSANGGRGLSFEEVPSELMAGVDVYKNPSADIIEGGLGGTVNLRTRMPFDEAGRKVAASVDYNYGDFAKRGNPSASFLFSDRWQTANGGEFGFLANLSYSELATRSDGIQVEAFQRRNDAALLEGTNFDWVYIPGGVNWRTLDFERKREGLALAMQWRPNDNTEVYTQFLRSKYNMQWREHSMTFGDQLQGADGAWRDNDILPAPGTRFSYDANGVFQSGYATRARQEIDWVNIDWDSIDWSQPWDPSITELCCGLEPYSLAFRTTNRLSRQETVTSDWSTGFRHFITDNLVMRGDFQYVQSSSKPVDFSVIVNTFLSNVYLDLTGRYPSLQLAAEREQLQDPASYSWLANMDNLQDNRGKQYSGRLDWEYTFDDSSWLRFARFGVRATSREQINKDSGWDNWMPVSATWATLDPGATGQFGSWDGGNQLAWLNAHLPQYSGLYSMGNFFRGQVNVPGNLWYPNDAIVELENAGAAFPPLYAARLAAGGQGWLPAVFNPQDTNNQQEHTQAAYGVLYFENDSLLGGRGVDGNVGVRIVQTSTQSDGYGQLPNLSGQLRLTEEVRERFDGSYFGIDSSGRYTDVLPSLNLRVHLNEQLQWRFAASKAIARPEFRQMTSWLPLRVGVDESCQPQQNDGTPCGFEYLEGFAGTAGNPTLQPMRANQLDTALEWYFGPADMLYATVFYKDVKGYFVSETRDEEIDGILWAVTRPHNLDSGKIQGFEVGWNQFFDFLPGIGVQTNYTFVDSSGGRNMNPDPNDPDARRPQVDDLPLEGLSRRSYNVVGIYEKGPWSLRLAYNWRSRYLLTASETNLQLPMWADDFGQLDGSFFYNINDNIQIGVQANNLTDSITKVLMGPRLYDDGYLDETLYTRSYFMNDRRYSAVLRARW
ncbi:TonB-dependent receptor [Pseudoxanthomonas suwonensis]|uniref:TonB-dependent receptor n=1 Tax=Pseudoxanthomonas suwonensis TaxID=314722 RepID=A0A0E3UNZ4_9GAMM|nr:TonB-dependent receptor [Pseudoxanthomonas suwonensis]AKC87591.1 TonB-dependent receptor [Pseudoxanthomonas suwonensis]